MSYSTTEFIFKVAFNLLNAGLSIALIVLIGSTQSQGLFFPNALRNSTAWVHDGASNCALNNDATKVCAYAIVLGVFGFLLAIACLGLTIRSLKSKQVTPFFVDLSLHVFGGVWWFVGSILLIFYVGRAQELVQKNPSAIPTWQRDFFDNGDTARTAVFAVSVSATCMYAVSLLFNFVLFFIAENYLVKYV